MRLPSTFAEWQVYCRIVRDQATRIKRMRDARGWKISHAVGIGRCMCCLHNCSIDTKGVGWAAGPEGPWRREQAILALSFLDDWQASRLADRIIQRGWDHYMNSPLGDSPKADPKQRQLAFH